MGYIDGSFSVPTRTKASGSGCSPRFSTGTRLVFEHTSQPVISRIVAPVVCKLCGVVIALIPANGDNVQKFEKGECVHIPRDRMGHPGSESGDALYAANKFIC